MRNSSMIGRLAAVGAVTIAVVVVAIIVLSGGSSYQVRAIFANAGQIVSGDLVQVAGNQVGTVSGIQLTPDGRAQLTLTIDNGSYSPLRQGTLATIRQASLSGIANRYVDLRLAPASAPKIPDNGVIPTQDTTTAVDFDQLFDTLNRPTLEGLQNVFQGSASQYAGKGKLAQQAWQYLNPAIASSSLLFSELNRDTQKFTNFIVKSGHLVGDLAQRQAQLSGLVSNLSTTFGALANQHVALNQAILRLPGFMRLADTTFVNLRYALTDLTPLVNVSKPVAPKLQRLLVQLRPFAADAAPTVKSLANIISRPGANNDLTELTALGVPLENATLKSINANGKVRPGAFPESTASLNGSTPELAVARPYAVDLTGWFEGFSHPGVIDANGGVSRIATTVGVASAGGSTINLCSGVILQLLPNCGQVVNGTPLSLLTNPGGRLSFAQGVLVTGQGDRCPGSMERGPQDPGSSAATYQTSTAYYPESGYPCTPSEVPTGQ